MRIKEIKVREVLPVKNFFVTNLTDTIVIAGPNGVGKSRLISFLINHIQSLKSQPNISLKIEATNTKEKRTWGKEILDTGIANDLLILKNSLSKNRYKRNWESGVIFFESDRTIQKINPFAFTWDLTDPNEEQASWNTTFTGIKKRFEDTVHSIFRMIEFQKRSIANKAISLKNEGKTSMNLEFGDPLQLFREAFSQLLAPKKFVQPSSRDQQLQYEFEGKVFNFNTLSSGEREVVNVVFDFILRKPKDCIVFFDEPELHLHPELSFKMIQTLRNIGENNQFVFCTHSPDIISSSLESSVVFLSPPKEDKEFNQAIIVSEVDETNQALRLLGHSIGIVALGKKIVLIEGKESSLDKQVYGSIIKDKFPNLVLVPTGGKDEITSFSKIKTNILDRSIWGVNFYLLTDHDSIPAHFNDSNTQESLNLKVLKKYHLENYFLDENIWAQIFTTMENEKSWLCEPEAIKEVFKNKAEDLKSYAISLTVSSLLRQNAGNLSIMPRNCHSKSLSEVEYLILDKAHEEKGRLFSILEEKNVKKVIQDIYTKVNESLLQTDDQWKNIIPGRPILHHFANKAKLPINRAKRIYINHVLTNNTNTFDDIYEIFNVFDEN